MATRFQQFKVQFYDSSALQAAIVARTEEGGNSISIVAKRDMGRYYEIIARSMPEFSVGEASLLVDALNGCTFEPHSTSHLWANIADAVEEGLDQKWGVDGSAFVARLRKLSYAACVAVIDAVERYWVGPYHQEGPMEEKLRKVGLVI